MSRVHAIARGDRKPPEWVIGFVRNPHALSRAFRNYSLRGASPRALSHFAKLHSSSVFNSVARSTALGPDQKAACKVLIAACFYRGAGSRNNSDRLWGKETRFGRAVQAGGRLATPTSRAEDSRCLPRRTDVWLAAKAGPDWMALTSRLSTWLWDERGPALWGP